MLDQQVPLIPDPKSLLLDLAQHRQVADVLKLIVDRLAMSPVYQKAPQFRRRCLLGTLVIAARTLVTQVGSA